MSLWKQLASNTDAEQNGIPVDLVGAEETWRFYVAAASDGNKRYLAAMERVRRKHKRAMSLETMSLTQQRDIVQEVYAETIVLRWFKVETDPETGQEREVEFTGPDGSAMPCTKPNILQLFKALPRAWQAVSEASSNPANFSLDSVEEDQGN